MIPLVLILTLGCGAPPPAAADLREVRLEVKGMSCDSCAQSIEKALDGTAGVQDATVEFDTTSAVVRFDGSRTDPAKLERVIDDLGFEASVIP